MLIILRLNAAMFDHCLYFNSVALARLVEREWSAVYARFGLTPAQGFVLRVVLASPGSLIGTNGPPCAVVSDRSNLSPRSASTLRSLCALSS